MKPLRPVAPPRGPNAGTIIVATLAALTALAAAAGPAAAATRYAEPAGDGPEPCLQSDPCSIQTAVAGSGDPSDVVDGDEILLAGGVYDVTGDAVGAFDQVTIRRAPGAGRPEITSTGGSTVALFASGVTIRGLLITGVDIPCCAAVIDPLFAAGGGLVERSIIMATGTGGYGLGAGGGITVRNSAIYADTPSGVAVNGRTGGARLVNVTAIAAAATGRGIVANGCFGEQELEVVNSIARGGEHDVALYEACPNDVTVDLSHSNYDHAYVEGPGPELTEGAGNQTDPPLLADPANGDFDQLPASPTVNAGLSAAAEGPTDLGGDPRIVGPAVDIGADELADTTAPALRIVGKRLRLKRNRVVRLRLRCPASEATPPCRGRLRLRTRKRVPFRGERARVTLGASRYRIGAGRTKVVRVRLAPAKARLVRNRRRARAVRAITRVRDGAGNSRRVAKPMRVRPR